MAVVAALLQVVMVPYAFDSLVRRDRPTAQERVSYVVPSEPTSPALPIPGPVTERAGRSAARRPAEPVRRPLVAPTEVPTGIPPAPAGPPTGSPGDDMTGPLGAARGAARGVQPGYSDPRIWVPPAAVASAPKSADARMDSVASSAIRRYADSVAAVAYEPNKFERGDWTVERNGRKYGIDQQAIRLGKVSIPLPLLALLPINAQGNPIAYQREKEISSLRAEIQFHSQRALNEQEFRRAVKALRERKDRERAREEEQRRGKTIAAPDASRPAQTP